MKSENVTLNTILKKYGLSDPYQLSRKDMGEVYIVHKNNDKLILKIQRDMSSYEREVGALKLLNSKMFQVPILLECGKVAEQNFVGYFLEEFWNGDVLNREYANCSMEKKKELLYESGVILGEMNTLFTNQELKHCGLWKYAYEGIDDYESYRWINLYMSRLANWLEIIKSDGDEMTSFFRESSNIMKVACEKIECDGKRGLIHRDFGFRNIMVENNHVKGIIDFEYAVPGDIEFDLSKLIFNDLDFWEEGTLRDTFFDGWEKSTGVKIEWNRLWLYLAIQGMGAVQWVDRQIDPQVRLENKNYREKGAHIMSEACTQLKKI